MRKAEKKQEQKETNKECDDVNCPQHGSVSVRGRIFEGKIIAAKMHRTATFELERRHYIPKYQRYEKRRTVIKAHNSECIGAKEGDLVRIQECRPLSKTKKFVITHILRVAQTLKA